MNLKKLSQLFVDFFKKNGHFLNSPSSVISENEDTLFTVAGMQQFSDLFLGKRIPKYTRQVTLQPCIRMSGKHNDLNQIGYTNRHNTLFTMMGNFSFYDYDQNKAISLAWEFLTNVLKIEKKRLYVTVHKNDHKSYEIWNKYIVNKNHICYASDETNFWSAGSIGLCGPSTEIFYDMNPNNNHNFSEHIAQNNDSRFLEIWNIVFIRFDRNSAGGLQPLQGLCIDTGMGLERLASVLNGSYDNFSCGSLKLLCLWLTSKYQNLALEICRKISDHIRTIVYLLKEDLIPGAVGRSYILRKLIRRVLIHQVKIQDGVEIVVKFLNLSDDIQLKIQSLIANEEQKFQLILKNACKWIKDSSREKEVVELFFTYGFPIHLSCQILKDRYGINLSPKLIDKFMNQHKRRSKNNLSISTCSITKSNHTLSKCNGKILEIYDNKFQSVCSVKNQDCFIITDQTCFFAREGGQAGDQGYINGKYKVYDTTYINHNNGRAIVLHVKNASMIIGDVISMKINQPLRSAHARAHSATHIMADFILRKFGGKQCGSSVKADEFTFDVNVDVKPHKDVIEKYVQDVIHESINVSISYDKNQKRIIQFGEKSKQMCCGTHVSNTSHIKRFYISSIKSIAQGVQRIRAYTNKIYQLDTLNTKKKVIDTLMEIYKSPNQIFLQCTGSKKTFVKKINKYIKKYKYVVGVLFIEKKQTQIIITNLNKTLVSYLEDDCKLHKYIDRDVGRFGGNLEIKRENFIQNILQIIK